MKDVDVRDVNKSECPNISRDSEDLERKVIDFCSNQLKFYWVRHFDSLVTECLDSKDVLFLGDAEEG